MKKLILIFGVLACAIVWAAQGNIPQGTHAYIPEFNAVKTDTIRWTAAGGTDTVAGSFTDTLTAAGSDTTAAININGCWQIVANWFCKSATPSTGSTVTITPQVSDDGRRWTDLIAWSVAQSGTSNLARGVAITGFSTGPTVILGTAASRNQHRQVLLNAALADSAVAGVLFGANLGMGGRAAIETASRMRFKVSVAAATGTDSTIGGIIVKRVWK